MESLSWEIQKGINRVVDMHLEILTSQISNLISIVEDHEKDMLKMVDKINELEKRLSELEKS